MTCNDENVVVFNWNSFAFSNQMKWKKSCHRCNDSIPNTSNRQVDEKNQIEKMFDKNRCLTDGFNENNIEMKKIVVCLYPNIDFIIIVY